jgi:hypothetical protein
MRVMVAHDSLMLCEGLMRPLTGHDMEVIGTTPPTSCWSWSPTGCRHHRHPNATDPHRRGSAGGTVHTRQAWAVLVLSQDVEVPLTMLLLGESASGVGYLLKDQVSRGWINQPVTPARKPSSCSATGFESVTLVCTRWSWCDLSDPVSDSLSVGTRS